MSYYHTHDNDAPITVYHSDGASAMIRFWSKGSPLEMTLDRRDAFDLKHMLDLYLEGTNPQD